MDVYARKPFSGPEKSFDVDEIIVSKTDLDGRLTYVNDVFIRVSGYSERELLGAPHNIIRHPDMPRSVFRLLWETIQDGKEIFAYVLNQSKDGTGYWVFAHVTPSYDPHNQHVGYHSNRRVPYTDALPAVKALYTRLLEEEAKFSSNKDAAAAGYALLQQILLEADIGYPEYVFSLSHSTRLETSVSSK
ncbi:MAG: PAS domain-containing protein [Nibricoccus sp.]